MRYLAALSPYITGHIKRSGDYVVNLDYKLSFSRLESLANDN
jgi:hypothetical protein